MLLRSFSNWTNPHFGPCVDNLHSKDIKCNSEACGLWTCFTGRMFCLQCGIWMFSWWVLSGYGRSLPYVKNMHDRYIKGSELPEVWVFFFFQMCSLTDWWQALGVPPPSGFKKTTLWSSKQVIAEYTAFPFTVISTWYWTSIYCT